MRSNLRDAYPYPTAGERCHVMNQLLSTFEDELWEYMSSAPLALDPPPSPSLSKHTHQLCGHDCMWGNCSTLEAICINCEFDVQDKAGRGPSPFRRQAPDVQP